ncbi:MAG: hypothetical protein HC880_11720 [Bacteroidia bacterium]|nr:hypothetical protein [Bacteroidia bacterium]
MSAGALQTYNCPNELNTYKQVLIIRLGTCSKIMKFVSLRLLLPGIWLILWLESVLVAQDFRPQDYLKEINPQAIIHLLELSPSQRLESLNIKMLKYKHLIIQEAERQFQQTLLALNQLRDPYYQYRVGLAARKWEGKNIYHDYGYQGRNDDSNTCVNGYCQIMSETGVPQLSELASGNIYFHPLTFEEERRKENPNIWQKTPKYINLADLLEDIEELGYLSIDLDLTQRGDLCVQYYRKQRLKDEFAPQHISIVDKIIPWSEGWFELRDWHEGIEGLPYVYRTGSNLKSSYNNIFRPENVYYGYRLDRGIERQLLGSNPNVCQGYAYFGKNVPQARELINRLNYLRGQLYVLQTLDRQYFGE